MEQSLVSMIVDRLVGSFYRVFSFAFDKPQLKQQSYVQ